MAYEIPVTQARAALADLINRVVYGSERVVVTRHGKPLVALVSAADLERLKALDASEAAAGGAPEESGMISTVSAVREVPSAASERRRFGIAAHHPQQQPPPHGRDTGNGGTGNRDTGNRDTGNGGPGHGS